MLKVVHELLRLWACGEYSPLAEAGCLALLEQRLQALAGWVAVHGEATARWGWGAITPSWAIYALVVFSVGYFLHERRQSWCGLAVLVVAIVRVFVVDLWHVSGGIRVLTFVVLAVVTLGLGYVYARHGERLKKLL